MIDKLDKIVSVTVGLVFLGLLLAVVVNNATCQRWETVPGEMRPVGGCTERCEPAKRCVQRRTWP